MTSRGSSVVVICGSYNNVTLNHSTEHLGAAVFQLQKWEFVCFCYFRVYLEMFFFFFCRTFVKYAFLMSRWSQAHDWLKLFPDWISIFFPCIFVLNSFHRQIEETTALSLAAHFRKCFWTFIQAPLMTHQCFQTSQHCCSQARPLLHNNVYNPRRRPWFLLSLLHLITIMSDEWMKMRKVFFSLSE